MAVNTATLQKILSTDILYRYADVLSAVGHAFQTNFTSEELYTLVKMQLANNASWDISSFTLTGTNGKSTTFTMPRTVSA